MTTIQPGDEESHEPIQPGFIRLATRSKATASASESPRQAFARAHGDGYCVHLGGPEDEELNGRYWWTLHRAGWSGVEASSEDWATEDQAMEDACRAHAAEVQHA